MTNAVSSGLTGVFSLGRGFRSANFQAQQVVLGLPLTCGAWALMQPALSFATGH